MIFKIKEYLLNIKVYVVSLILVQFNKLVTIYSNRRCGRPKDSWGLKQLEFGISRSVCTGQMVCTLGKRRTYSTFCSIKKRKESSYTKFIRLVLNGSDLYKNLIKLNNQLIFLSCSRDLIYLFSNFEFLKLSWDFVRFKNKLLFLKKNKKLLGHQFELWSCLMVYKFKPGKFSFGASSGFQDSMGFKFLYGDWVITQSLYNLVLIIFERFLRQFMEINELSHGIKLNQIRINSECIHWLLTGNLIFNKARFMVLFSQRIIDQSLKDLLYKYFNSNYFNSSSVMLNKIYLFESCLLSLLVLNIYSNSFDEWVEDSLLFRYIEGIVDTFYSKLGVKFLYIRHLSSFFMGLYSSREISLELVNRVEEKVHEMSSDYNSNLIFQFKRAIFLGYTIKSDSLCQIKVIVVLETIVLSLQKLGFVSNRGVPTRNCRYLNSKVSTVLTNYNRVGQVILKQCSLADNFDDLYTKVFYLLKYSCALTICSKMRLKTLRKTFEKYGSYLGVKDGNKLIHFKLTVSKRC